MRAGTSRHTIYIYIHTYIYDVNCAIHSTLTMQVSMLVGTPTGIEITLVFLIPWISRRSRNPSTVAILVDT